MSPGSRERTTLDLRGLGPSLRAHAKARNMVVSAVARMAVAKMLEGSGALVGESDASPGVGAGPAVKVTIRVSRRIARKMATRAHAVGLSHGVYVSTLVDAVPVAVDHKEAVRALAISTDRLATVAADLNDFARLVRREMSPSVEHIDDAVATVVREVRSHLRMAARLANELKPMAAWRCDAGSSGHGSGSWTTP